MMNESYRVGILRLCPRPMYNVGATGQVNMVQGRGIKMGSAMNDGIHTYNMR